MEIRLWGVSSAPAASTILFELNLSQKVFWPKRGVGASFQLLEIPEYTYGLKLRSALLLRKNPHLWTDTK